MFFPMPQKSDKACSGKWSFVQRPFKKKAKNLSAKFSERFEAVQPFVFCARGIQHSHPAQES
jgi:hypothetical protein